MPEPVSLELFLAVWLSILGPFILLGILSFIIFIFARRAYRYYSIPSALRAEEHRRWEIGRVKEWIRVRREVVDRGWESLGVVLEDEGEVGREARWAQDERLGELEGRLRELEEEDRAGLMDVERGDRRID